MNQTQLTPEKGPKRGGNVLAFIVVFISCTILLLIAYRYLINTSGNDRYLFQVASHTAWVLEKIGYRVELEKHSGPKNSAPALVRATHAAWRRGGGAPAQEDIALASKAPLTAWEKWSFRALSARRHGSKEPIGPSIYFILKPEIGLRIEDAEDKLAALALETDLPQDQRDAQIAATKEKLAVLRERDDAMPADTEDGRDDRRLSSLLNIAPECGAIEIFAIFLAAVIAFPTQGWKRLLGILLGIPILYVVNIFRLACLFVIAAFTRGGDSFKFIHEYVWQSVYIVFVAVLWLAWMEFLVRRKSK